MFLYARDEIHSHAAPNLRAELKMELRGCVWFESAVMTGLERQQQRGAPWKFIPSLPAARQYSPPPGCLCPRMRCQVPWWHSLNRLTDLSIRAQRPWTFVGVSGSFCAVLTLGFMGRRRFRTPCWETLLMSFTRGAFCVDAPKVSVIWDILGAAVDAAGEKHRCLLDWTGPPPASRPDLLRTSCRLEGWIWFGSSWWRWGVSQSHILNICQEEAETWAGFVPARTHWSQTGLTVFLISFTHKKES